MPEDEDEGSQPTSDADASISPERDARLTTAARALALGNGFFSRDSLLGLELDLARLNLEIPDKKLFRWEARMEAFNASDDLLRSRNLLDVVRESEERRLFASAGQSRHRRPALVDLWRIAAESSQQDAGIAWLRLLMADGDPLLSAAAAASIAPRSRVPQGAPEHPAMSNARAALRAYRESGDPLASEIARAAQSRLESTPPQNLSRDERSQQKMVDGVSLLVHGTFSYIGTWWRSAGDFHQFILQNVRGNLYAGSRPFYWSGVYKGKHRDQASSDLFQWAQDFGGQLDCVFAHSYGGIVALGASSLGLKISKLILLSTPVHAVPTEWRNIGSAVSLRIHLDLVLLAARRRQLFTENVTEHHMPAWFIHHGDSHEPMKWESQEWAQRLGL